MEESLKKRRKCLNFGDKYEIVQAFENGQSLTKIANDRKMAISSVQTIIRNKEVIKDKVMNTPATHMVRARSYAMEHMERSLLSWIQENNEKNISLSRSVIKSKALSLYEAFKVTQEDKSEADINETFSASNGWMDRFYKRTELGIIETISNETIYPKSTISEFHTSNVQEGFNDQCGIV